MAGRPSDGPEFGEGIRLSPGKDGWQGHAAVAKDCAVPVALGN